jgi:hypothetical protein
MSADSSASSISRAPAGPRWRREGHILAPPADHGWWKSHAQAPTILPLSDRQWRIYFGARDRDNRSHIISIDVDPLAQMAIVERNFRPILDLGRPGSFDHDGMAPSAALLVEDRVLLYYTGVALRRDVPYQLAIGLAVSKDGGTSFQRAMPGPVLANGPYDPYFVSTPAVRHREQGFDMWYVSALAWCASGDSFDPIYNIRHARSGDGIAWTTSARPALELAEGEAGITRAWPSETRDGLRMWLCARGAGGFRSPSPNAYRLLWTSVCNDGSFDPGTRPVTFANPPQPDDWDSWMQAYPCVAASGRDLILVYNGNGFGKTGFGYARLKGGAVQ